MDSIRHLFCPRRTTHQVGDDLFDGTEVAVCCPSRRPCRTGTNLLYCCACFISKLVRRYYAVHGTRTEQTHPTYGTYSWQQTFNFSFPITPRRRGCPIRTISISKQRPCFKTVNFGCPAKPTQLATDILGYICVRARVLVCVCVCVRPTPPSPSTHPHFPIDAG